MPIYEYVCKNCGVFEVLQKIRDNDLIECPLCNDEAKKIISVPGLPILYGSGFYYTDYVRKSKKEKE